MVYIIVLLSVIVLAQMAMIYGLIQRLLRQAGHSRMKPASLPESLTEGQVPGGKVDKTPRQVIEQIHIGI